MKRIYEIINKGKGVIVAITPSNLLKIEDDTAQNNIPLKVDILSTDLATNDIAGFVDYVNALDPALTVLETNSLVQFYLTDTKEIYQFVGVGKGVYGGGQLQIESSKVLKYNDVSSSSGVPTLPQVLAQGDRTIRLSDGDGETILELNDRGKLVYNQDGDFILLPAELYPVNTVLKIHNVSDVDLFCIPDVDNNPSIQVNGVTVDEFSGITLRAGTAVLKKISGDAYAESWLLTFEVLDFSKDAIGLGSVDNTADLSKPVSTAQAAAIASALSVAQSYTDNVLLKRPARVAIDSNVPLSGGLTIGPIVLVTGDVVLCLAQTDAKENGLWVVNQLGPWVRTQDFRTGLDVSFCWFPVLGGNYAGRFFATGAGRIVGTNNINLQDNTFVALLTGISFLDGSDVTASDNLLQALGKLQRQNTVNKTLLDQKDVLPVLFEKHANVPTWGGTALNNLEGFAFTITGATARNFADTNAYTRRQRMGLTVATTGNLAQARQTTTYFNRNSNLHIILGLGFAENCTNANVRAFAGVSATTLFTNVEPTALLNCIGLAKLTTSNNLHLIHNDGSGTATAIDLGASFPSNTIETDFYTLELKTNGSNIDYLVTRVNTGDTASGTISSDLPSASTALNLGYYVVQSTGANTATGVDYFGTNIIKS